MCGRKLKNVNHAKNHGNHEIGEIIFVAGSRLRWELLHHQLQLFSRPPRYSNNKLEERTMRPIVMTGQKLQTEFVIFYGMSVILFSVLTALYI